LGIAIMAGCNLTAAEGMARAEQLYGNCVNCHAPDGSGMQSIGAPGIAGLPQWYVEAQIRNFQQGIRGYHPDDIEGLRMRPMSLSLATIRGDEELNSANIEAVASYVASMTPVEHSTTVEGGDAKQGQVKYALCMACHGPDGAGNEALHAPPINNANDWYMVAQIGKFKTGQRGTHAKDTWGATMRPMAMTLTDDQAVKDVVAYVQTLGK